MFFGAAGVGVFPLLAGPAQPICVAVLGLGRLVEVDALGFAFLSAATDGKFCTPDLWCECWLRGL